MILEWLLKKKDLGMGVVLICSISRGTVSSQHPADEDKTGRRGDNALCVSPAETLYRLGLACRVVSIGKAVELGSLASFVRNGGQVGHNAWLLG